MNMLTHASSERQFIMYEALRKGADIDELHKKTHISNPGSSNR
jgi:carbamoyl-phosphate synthase large subunit